LKFQKLILHALNAMRRALSAAVRIVARLAMFLEINHSCTVAVVWLNVLQVTLRSKVSVESANLLVLNVQALQTSAQHAMVAKASNTCTILNVMTNV